MRTVSDRRRCGPAPAVVTGALLLAALAGCTGSGDPTGGLPASPPVDPAVRAYCDTVARVQAEQTAPGAGQGGPAATAELARRQAADLATTAPPEVADDWRTVRDLTDRALGALAATGGDANRVDRAALVALEQEAQPAVERIDRATRDRCGVAVRPPA